MSCECGMCAHKNKLDCEKCQCCENIHANFVTSKSIINKELLLD